jgi:hypothetical protein
MSRRFSAARLLSQTIDKALWDYQNQRIWTPVARAALQHAFQQILQVPVPAFCWHLPLLGAFNVPQQQMGVGSAPSNHEHVLNIHSVQIGPAIRSLALQGPTFATKTMLRARQR